ncbi:hypothetical protein MEBOL_004164 [Melittangium boletus DSM 14713]|uniref:Uncharacterized protein n=1 Tax=Melittangium boletus DSM 14713 TaxID=1294270 RepID=A0A250IHJ6_9BACT|nr:hypothetical protein MEBOL_004164 [Melittangium boletus DSM 14713]
MTQRTGIPRSRATSRGSVPDSSSGSDQRLMTKPQAESSTTLAPLSAVSSRS